MRPDGNLVNKQLSHTVCQDRVTQRHRAAPVTQSPACIRTNLRPLLHCQGNQLKHDLGFMLQFFYWIFAPLSH